jgi:hypothetical protein
MQEHSARTKQLWIHRAVNAANKIGNKLIYAGTTL